MIMDKLTIVLSEKTTVAELAKDPDVSIKIKDAIIDGVMRRLTPISNAIAHSVINEVLVKNGWGDPTDKLTEKWEKVVRLKVAEVVSNELDSIVREEVRKAKKEVLDRLKYEIDIKRLVEQAVSRNLADGVIIATKE